MIFLLRLIVPCSSSKHQQNSKKDWKREFVAKNENSCCKDAGRLSVANHRKGDWRKDSKHPETAEIEQERKQRGGNHVKPSLKRPIVGPDAARLSWKDGLKDHGNDRKHGHLRRHDVVHEDGRIELVLFLQLARHDGRDAHHGHGYQGKRGTHKVDADAAADGETDTGGHGGQRAKHLERIGAAVHDVRAQHGAGNCQHFRQLVNADRVGGKRQVEQTNGGRVHHTNGQKLAKMAERLIFHGTRPNQSNGA